MLKFNVQGGLRANRLSKGDALDKSVEAALAKCPVGKAVLVEPLEVGGYLVRRGFIEPPVTVTVVKPKPKEIKYKAPEKMPVKKTKKSKKKGK